MPKGSKQIPYRGKINRIEQIPYRGKINRIATTKTGEKS